MKAILLDVMGSDLKVVNAARVSFAKQHDYLDLAGDTKLINYLAKHNHWTPFGHCQATFHVKAPIFVARQLVKHTVGLVWNEVSRRYVSDNLEFYWPEDDQWRLQAQNIKQGSSEEVLQDTIEKVYLLQAMHNAEAKAIGAYNYALKIGVAPEMARMILPVNLYTEWHWTGSLMAFARVCKLRLDPHAQKETQMIAKDISEALSKEFPISWEALMVKE